MIRYLLIPGLLAIIPLSAGPLDNPAIQDAIKTQIGGAERARLPMDVPVTRLPAATPDLVVTITRAERSFAGGGAPRIDYVVKNNGGAVAPTSDIRFSIDIDGPPDPSRSNFDGQCYWASSDRQPVRPLGPGHE